VSVLAILFNGVICRYQVHMLECVICMSVFIFIFIFIFAFTMVFKTVSEHTTSEYAHVPSLDILDITHGLRDIRFHLHKF
jgi:hypothetical protein